MDKIFLQEAGYFFGHVIERDAIFAGDMFFLGVMFPRREDKDAAGSDGIKESGGGFIIIAEAVVGKEDEGVFFGEEDGEYFFFVLRDKRRDHDGALSGGYDASVHIVAEGLRCACEGFFDKVAVHMNGVEAVIEKYFGITDAAIDPAGYFNVVLYAEEAGHELFGSESLGVHFDVLHHTVQLPMSGHRPDEGVFGEDREDILFVFPNVIRAN